MFFDLTMKSFKHLLSACPRWIGPLAYGGPSCKTYPGAPFLASRMRSYSRISPQRSRILGSFWGRFAFIGKPVLGRLMVDFRSTRWELQTLAALHYRE